MTREPISWETAEHAYNEKTSDWYWIVGIVGLTIAILAWLFGNALLGGVMIVGTLTIMLHGAKRPRIIRVELNGNGVRIGSHFHPYNQLKAFSLDEESDPQVLVLDIKSPLLRDVHLFLHDISAENVRQFLLDHLDEKYHEPSFAEGLIHYLGF